MTRCAFDDLAARRKAWASFMTDPEWQAASRPRSGRSSRVRALDGTVAQI
jgi:hypothetical protein